MCFFSLTRKFIYKFFFIILLLFIVNTHKHKPHTSILLCVQSYLSFTLPFIPKRNRLFFKQINIRYASGSVSMCVWVVCMCVRAWSLLLYYYSIWKQTHRDCLVSLFRSAMALLQLLLLQTACLLLLNCELCRFSILFPFFFFFFLSVFHYSFFEPCGIFYSTQIVSPMKLKVFL